MGSPPSNGTMGQMWVEYWCERCVNDHAATHVTADQADYEHGCELLARMYMGYGEDFPELIEHNYDIGQGWHPRHLECRMFERCPCRDNPGWEPVPPPTPDPNQGLLFDVIDDSPAVPGGAVIMPAIETVSVTGGVL